MVYDFNQYYKKSLTRETGKTCYFKIWQRLKSAQDSPVNFNIIEFKRVSEFITVGKLEAHQAYGDKEIKPEPDTVKFRFYIQRFVVELAVLPEDIEESLAPDEIAVL